MATSLRFRTTNEANVEVDGSFDVQDELSIDVTNRWDENLVVWLSRDHVERLRDHLSAVLAGA